jgi:hypothetical protein
MQAVEPRCDSQALWLIGPTAMFISSIVTTSAVAFLDFHLVSERTFVDILQKVQAKATSSAA